MTPELKAKLDAIADDALDGCRECGMRVSSLAEVRSACIAAIEAFCEQPPSEAAAIALAAAIPRDKLVNYTLHYLYAGLRAAQAAQLEELK